jgi:hypothetical protein
VKTDLSVTYIVSQISIIACNSVKVKENKIRQCDKVKSTGGNKLVSEVRAGIFGKWR